MNDIWHTPPEQPDPFKSWNILVVYEANDRKEMMYSTQFLHATDGMYVNRWCYLDDLLALETELDRTRKALKMALKELKQLKYGGKADRTYLKNKAGKALEQITALEQKG